MKSHRALLLTIGFALGCSARGDSAPTDAGAADAVAVDAPVDDASAPVDLGGSVDLGVPTDVAATTDAGTVDTGADAGVSDLGVDTGAVDAGTPDVGVDAGTPDVGVDAGAPDVGVDAGSVDAGPATRYRVVLDPPGVTHLDACAATGATRLFRYGDDERTRVSLPFAFRFWATNHPAGSPVNVTTNGWISLSDTTETRRSSTLGITYEPNAVIAPFWRDIVMSGEGMCVATMGASPDRRFVVEWRNATDTTNASTRFSFELVLHETTNLIDFSYVALSSPYAASVGLENQAGTEAVSSCAADAGAYCRPTVGSRVRYQPIP